jgi:hypothetical protein
MDGTTQKDPVAGALEARIFAALAGAGGERGGRAPEVEDLLTEGYAHAHLLERRSLRLERRCNALVAEGAPGEELSAILAERHRVERRLLVLRERLSVLHSTAAAEPPTP